jgi:hypothetical protein
MKPSDDEVFSESFEQAVALGNEMAEQDSEADVWDIADGMLAGAIQYWLYSRQPCGDPQCTDCALVNTAEERMQELTRLVAQLAKESEYYHSPSDTNVGRA